MRQGRRLERIGRGELARAEVERELIARRPTIVFLSGDGNLTSGLTDVCRIQGVDADAIRSEPFFNTEKKKASPAIP